MFMIAIVPFLLRLACTTLVLASMTACTARSGSDRKTDPSNLDGVIPGKFNLYDSSSRQRNLETAPGYNTNFGTGHTVFKQVPLAFDTTWTPPLPDKSSSYEQHRWIDLDGDGIPEFVGRIQHADKESIPKSYTAIGRWQGKKFSLFMLIEGGEHPVGSSFADVTGDGRKELILYDQCGNHYTLLMIYTFMNGFGRCIFKNGTATYVCSVESGTVPASIVIGRENWADTSYCYACSDSLSLREVYVWNGKAFEYSPKLSTTPLIGERQALENTWLDFKKMLQKITPKSADDSRYKLELLRLEFMWKMWNGGSRAYEFFGKDMQQRRNNLEKLQVTSGDKTSPGIPSGFRNEVGRHESGRN
jgi:hypothetical protein